MGTPLHGLALLMGVVLLIVAALAWRKQITQKLLGKTFAIALVVGLVWVGALAGLDVPHDVLRRATTLIPERTGAMRNGGCASLAGHLARAGHARTSEIPKPLGILSGVSRRISAAWGEDRRKRMCSARRSREAGWLRPNSLSPAAPRPLSPRRLPRPPVPPRNSRVLSSCFRISTSIMET